MQVIARIKQETKQLNEKYSEDLGKHESTSQEVTSLRSQISELKQVLCQNTVTSVHFAYFCMWFNCNLLCLNLCWFASNQDLNASLSASVAREQETSGQVSSLEKTRNELVAELNRCIEQGMKQVCLRIEKEIMFQ